MKIVDLHCDTFLRCFQRDYRLAENCGHIDAEKLRQGGSLAQFFAIFLPFDGVDKDGVHYDRYELFQEVYKLYLQELDDNKDNIASASSFDDIKKNEDAGKISAILTVEDGALIEGDMERLYELYDKGVRLLTLTWNFENCFGFPNSADSDEHAKGLKDFGFDAVAEMNRLGMIVDVSHLSEGGFWDVARHSKKPFVASHSCARALCSHQRNLTDEQLKSVADHGGVVGVNFYSKFLRDECEHTSTEDILWHIDYMLNKMGKEGVALGSDFDGIDCTLDIEDYSKMPMLVEALETKYSADIVDKICSKNALRVIKDCL